VNESKIYFMLLTIKDLEIKYICVKSQLYKLPPPYHQTIPILQISRQQDDFAIVRTANFTGSTTMKVIPL